MADEVVKFSRGESASIPLDHEAGRFLVETDTGNMYLDITASARIQIKDGTKAPSDHTHQPEDVEGFTPSSVVVSDSEGKLTSSGVTSTELNYLDGVTSNIQTQLNSKASTSHTHNYAGSSSAGGAANSAVKLSTARDIKVDLTSSSAASFDGTGNVTPGVTGVLGISNGGTGNSSGYIRTGQRKGSEPGEGSTAEGVDNASTGEKSHTEGWSNEAGYCSHAEGDHNTASGDSSHAEGSATRALGSCSHAEGRGTTASRDFSHVQGCYNIEDTEEKYLHIVGNGTGIDDESSNAHTLDFEGNAWFQGVVKCGGTGQDDPESWVSSLPKYTSSDNNKVLGVVGGLPTWVDNNGSSAPFEILPVKISVCDQTNWTPVVSKTSFLFLIKSQTYGYYIAYLPGDVTIDLRGNTTAIRHVSFEVSRDSGYSFTSGSGQNSSFEVLVSYPVGNYDSSSPSKATVQRLSDGSSYEFFNTDSSYGNLGILFHTSVFQSSSTGNMVFTITSGNVGFLNAVST